MEYGTYEYAITYKVDNKLFTDILNAENDLAAILLTDEKWSTYKNKQFLVDVKTLINLTLHKIIKKEQ